MRRGLVLGKFMPLHKGHIQLIEFAMEQCDSLIVWICVSNKETMPAQLRLNWVKEQFKEIEAIEPVLLEYEESQLPNSSESSRAISKVWAGAIKQYLPPIDVFVSSEPYGDYVAEYLGVEHVFFKTKRLTSASTIRKNPFAYWSYIPQVVKPYFFRKICIAGTESTGKSTLTLRLAEHFNADFVSEVGRDVVATTNTCVADDLQEIAVGHAQKIIEAEQNCNKMLFIDTDINITKSYSKYLFQQELVVEPWIEEANKCDLYLYLNNDAPFVQDGTRLCEDDRNLLDASHKRQFEEAGINYFLITGTWDDRFWKAVQIIEQKFTSQ